MRARVTVHLPPLRLPLLPSSLSVSSFTDVIALLIEGICARLQQQRHSDGKNPSDAHRKHGKGPGGGLLVISWIDPEISFRNAPS